MLLAVDIGNTDIVIGLHDGTAWIKQWRNPTDKAEAFTKNLQQWLAEFSYSFSEIKWSIISSVVPQKTEQVRAVLASLLEPPPLLLGPSLYDKFSIQIDNPDEIGADLVANAYAAYERFKQSCVVVDFGTALSFTTVSAEGVILGVSIAPGLKTAMHALFSNTAQLPQVPLELPKTAIGKNTAHALQAGILLGYIGLVKEILSKIEWELGESPKVLATGGLVNILSPLHPIFDWIDPLHTLEGLRLIAERFSGN